MNATGKSTGGSPQAPHRQAVEAKGMLGSEGFCMPVAASWRRYFSGLIGLDSMVPEISAFEVAKTLKNSRKPQRLLMLGQKTAKQPTPEDRRRQEGLADGKNPDC